MSDASKREECICKNVPHARREKGHVCTAACHLPGCPKPTAPPPENPATEEGICPDCGVDYGDEASLCDHMDKGCDCRTPSPPRSPEPGERVRLHRKDDKDTWSYCFSQRNDGCLLVPLGYEHAEFERVKP